MLPTHGGFVPVAERMIPWIWGKIDKQASSCGRLVHLTESEIASFGVEGSDSTECCVNSVMASSQDIDIGQIRKFFFRLEDI
jgi:hypothetical protein